MARRQWGQLIANSLRQLGIDARLVYLGWVGVFDRVFTPARELVGKTWDEGGFDMQLVGWTPGLLPEPRQNYYGGDPAFFAPDGQNYPLFNNTEANQLLDTFITTTDLAVQEESLLKYQEIFHDELPSSQILYEAQPVVVNPELEFAGDWWLYFNVQPSPEYLTGKTSVVYSSVGEIESLIAPLANSWYDTIIHNVVHDGLAHVATDLSDYAIPALLTSWTPSDDGFKWTYTCRSGVKWHDGEDFTADDVVFSHWALMSPDTGSQFVGYYQSVFGDNVKFTYLNGTSTTLGNGTKMGNMTAVDQYTVELWLPEILPGKAYGYFDPFLLTFANNIIPKHIYETIEPVLWTDSPFNTGQGSIEINGKTYTGPVGTGPYKWVSFDPVTQLVHLEKNEDYWAKSVLEAAGLFEVEDYYIKYIVDKTPAIAALKNKEVDMLDPNYYMMTDVPTIDPAWGTVVSLEGTGRQEVGYNHRHPIFGTGVDTPLGKSDPSRAAEAARYVRLAIDHSIPRQLIIDNLLDGWGTPGATNMLPTQPYYNTATVPREYDLDKAREYLALAGYAVPGPPPPPPPLPTFIAGMSHVITGVYTATGTTTPVANKELSLLVTTDNATYTTTSTLIGKTVTDLDGWYSFTVTPPGAGTYHYYLFDRLAIIGTEYQYLTEVKVSSMEDLFQPIQTQISDLQLLSDDIAVLSTQISALQDSISSVTNIAYAAVILAALIGAVAIYMARKS
jgi:ABC-type transport system substrate-binding protein